MHIKSALTIFLCLFLSFFVFAHSHAADEETKRLLLEIKSELKVTNVELKATNQKIDDLDKRLSTEIKANNQRIDELDKRLTAEIKATNQRINDLYTAIGYLTAAVTAILIASIGFAYWDRKTAIQQAKKETIAEIEAIGRLRDVISALRELANRDAELKGLLHQFHLL